MRNAAFEQKLATVEALRKGPVSPETGDALRKFLRDRNNFVVSKAAAAVGALGLKDLIPDLCAAFERFLADAVKTDPQCWAKSAIAKALADLGHDEPGVFLGGLAHEQFEPVWGGRQDTAGPLRGACALALVSCRGIGDVDLLRHLTTRLTDREGTVRVDTVRAIGHIGRAEGALLLRLRALIGDDEPEVMGACFSTLLSLEGGRGIEFVGGFLERGGDAAGEAALALGLTHEAAALELLRERWTREPDPETRVTLLTGIALTRLAEAVGFLIGLVADGGTAAESALRAAAAARVPDDVAARLKDAVARSGDPRLDAAFERHMATKASGAE